MQKARGSFRALDDYFIDLCFGEMVVKMIKTFVLGRCEVDEVLLKDILGELEVISAQLIEINEKTAPERVTAMPLLALVETWRIKAHVHKEKHDDPLGTAAYLDAADSLEKWVKVGTIPLGS